VELDLNRYLPGEEWGRFSLRLILHGRRVCDARRPRCDECELADICPSAGKARSAK
jgi:endonuclease-3